MTFKELEKRLNDVKYLSRADNNRDEAMIELLDAMMEVLRNHIHPMRQPKTDPYDPFSNYVDTEAAKDYSE